MNERIEWIEPEEATRERRARRHAELRKASILAFRLGMVVGIPATLIPPFLNLEPRDVAIGVASILVVPIYIPALFGLAVRFDREPSERTCVLSSDDSELWQRVRSFEIADHPILPGIRTLTILRRSEPRRIQHCFRIGQLDEVELSHFVGSRIAEQRAARLMRRVRRKL